MVSNPKTNKTTDEDLNAQDGQRIGKEVKIVRLRDIVYQHLKNHECTDAGQTTLGQIGDLEEDIKKWVKNGLLFFEDTSCRPDVGNLGGNNKDIKSLEC